MSGRDHRSRAGLLLVALVVCALAARILWQINAGPDDELHRAEAALNGGQLDEAERHARLSLRANPLDGRAYRVLAQSAGRRGDHQRLADMTVLALRYAPRDLATRALATELAIERGDDADAVRHCDRLLRVAPEQSGAIFPVLRSLALSEAGRAELLDRLAARPLWRGAFLQSMAQATPQAANLPPLFHALGKRGGLDASEMAAYIGRFVAEARWQEGFLAWTNELPVAQLTQLNSPIDGDFETAVLTGAPFEWQIPLDSAVESRILPREDGRGRALRVLFAGTRGPFDSPRQLLLLQPGQRYRLRWRSQLQSLDTPRGIQWVLRCAVDAKATAGAEPLLRTEPQRGSNDWRPWEAEFAVPVNCPAQWLSLELDARILAESAARGTVWLDDVAILAVDPATP